MAMSLTQYRVWNIHTMGTKTDIHKCMHRHTNIDIDIHTCTDAHKIDKQTQTQIHSYTFAHTCINRHRQKDKHTNIHRRTHTHIA